MSAVTGSEKRGGSPRAKLFINRSRLTSPRCAKWRAISYLVPGVLVDKEFVTYEQQVELLRSRGMVIEDADFAISVLRRVSYYRLRGYYFMDLQGGPHAQFDQSTTFETIWRRYLTDQGLRHLLFSAIDVVETRVRTLIGYQLGERLGPFGYLDSSHFNNEDHHRGFLRALRLETERSTELFAQHHRRKYQGRMPIWVAVELISFGTLSKFYRNMIRLDQKSVSLSLGIPSEDVLVAFLRALTILRNICAHHGRIYARTIAPGCPLLKSDLRTLEAMEPSFILNPRSVFPTILAIARLLQSEDRSWLREELARLVDDNHSYEASEIGMPACWKSLI